MHIRRAAARLLARSGAASLAEPAQTSLDCSVVVVYYHPESGQGAGSQSWSAGSATPRKQQPRKRVPCNYIIIRRAGRMYVYIPLQQ